VTNEANERIEEAVSAELARQLGGVPRRHDDGSEDGMHDAFVDVGDRTIAVEITGETDPDSAKAAHGSRKHPIDPTGLSMLWDVSLTEGTANRRLLSQKLPAILRRFEKEGRTGVEASGDPELVIVPGVLRVDAHQGDAGVVLSHVSAYSAGAIDTLEAVERHAQLLDNLRKLKRSTADERHLVVWVSVTATLPYAGLNEMGLLPVADPMVDEAIDVVRAMRLEKRDGEIEIPVVWRWSRADGWQYVGSQPPVLSD
jgi:hypothetical protein